MNSDGQSAQAVGPLLPEVKDFGQKHGLPPVAQEELQSIMNASIVLTSKRVTVSVPASIANLGPGLETCGLAVDIWDEFTLEYAEVTSVEVVGDSTSEVPRSVERNLAVAGAKSAFEDAGRPFPALRVRCLHRIPYCRGLGGPPASFVGGYLAGSVLCGEELSTLPKVADKVPEAPEKPEAMMTRANSLADALGTFGQSQGGIDMLLQRAISRGWNPANVCPTIYGALQIGIEMPDGCKSHRVPVPNGLICVLFVPDAQPEGTPLSQQPVERKAAIFNVGRMALLVNCFCSNNFSMFAKATEDTLTQPHCSAQFPYVRHVVQAAIDAGASGAVPAGYGPSVMALITGRCGDILAQSSFNELERAVAKAMLSKADAEGVPGKIFITKPSDEGAHVLAEKSELCANLGTDRIVYFQ